MRILRPLATLVCLALLAPGLSGHAPRPDGASAASAAPSGTPVERPTRVLRWYAFEGELPRRELEALLAELDARLVHGPAGSNCRPKVFALAVEAPASLESRTLERALRKAKLAAEPLWVTCFEPGDGGAPRLPSLGVGLDTQDAILGMASELRWHARDAELVQFWVTSAKLGAREISSRYERLFAPFGGARLGEPALDELRWTFAEGFDPKALERALKKIRRLPGVRGARWLSAEHVLELSLALEGLALSPAPGTPPASGPPRPSWFTPPLLDLLLGEGLEALELGENAGEDVAPEERGR